MWDAGTGEVITAAEATRGVASARAYLDAFYEERLRELGARQRQYLEAAARLEPDERTAGAIAAAMGARSEQLASTWQALVHRHGLLRQAGGQSRLRFALPGLDDYLRTRTARGGRATLNARR